ncbi:MAG: hypothetical protein HC898_13060 [Phycisphaerales bacterium]|nr:hypothetical protein [Phycisphaerales bacterium]
MTITEALPGFSHIHQRIPRMMQNSKKIKLEGYGLNISFDLVDNRLRQLLIHPSGYEVPSYLSSQALNPNQEVALHCTGNDQPVLHGNLMTGGLPGMRLEYMETSEVPTATGKKIIHVQYDPISQLKVESVYQFFKGTSAIRRYTRLRAYPKTDDC